LLEAGLKMSKTEKRTLLSINCIRVGICLLVVPAMVQVSAVAGDLKEVDMRSMLLAAADENEQADSAVPAVENQMEEQGPHISATAGDSEVMVGVTTEFSTWKDLFSIFYPSRWAHPFQAGGTLSWLNYRAWIEVPGRTFKVLAGEVIIAGATYATVRKPGSGENGSFGSSSGSSTAAASGSSSGGGGSSADGSSGTVLSGGAGSGSGGSSPAVVEPPVEQP